MAQAKFVNHPLQAKSWCEKPGEIQLTLSRAEAKLIKSLVGGTVTGSDTSSPRKYSNSVWEALEELGVPGARMKYVADEHTVHFKDDSLEMFLSDVSNF